MEARYHCGVARRVSAGEGFVTDTTQIAPASPHGQGAERDTGADGGPRTPDGRAGGGAFRLYRDGGKRALDVALVLAGSVVVIPLLAVLAALVACDGHSPFFRQPRLGRRGRVFPMLKLRTMVPQAESALREIIAADPDAAAEWKAHQKLRRDPRVTALGRFLRRTSLDELPQLWNVLRGEMSLVGPRPMMPRQRRLYPGTAYYELRPGITGLWQVSARNDDRFDSRAAYDARYLEHVSLGLDLRTLARTAVVVARGTGC